MLGKRKRPATRPVEKEAEETRLETPELDAQEIFRRHFESQFKPLPPAKKKPRVVEEVLEDKSEEESDWDGISEGEEEGVQVIEHTDSQTRMAAMSKEELRAFMVIFPTITIGLR